MIATYCFFRHVFSFEIFIATKIAKEEVFKKTNIL